MLEIPKYTAAIVGAGKTGRGFIARLLLQAGIPFALLDTNPALMQTLRQRKEFSIRFFSDKLPQMQLCNIQAEQMGSAEANALLQNCNLIFVSVGANNLPEAAKSIGSALSTTPTQNRNIFLCENAINPAQQFKKDLADVMGSAATSVGVCEAAVFCTTVENPKDALSIESEAFPYLVYNTLQALGSIPSCPQLKGDPNFSILLQRKIYTYNASSAIICYLGAALGLTSFSQAANIKEIGQILEDFYKNINFAICQKYGVPTQEQQQFSLMAFQKFADPEILDTNERNCNQPERKLASSERIAFPITLLQKYHLDAASLCLTAGAAIRYGELYSPDWNTKFKKTGCKEVFTSLSGITSNTALTLVSLAYEGLNPYPITARQLAFLYQKVKQKQNQLLSPS